MKPVAFFGLSGVGKTTLARGLANLYSDSFVLVPITTSRMLRDDDDLRYVEVVSEADFISQKGEGGFAMAWKQDGNYYGYRRKHFENGRKSPILTCSLSAAQIVKEYSAVTVLVKGDGVKGLEARGADEVTRKRTQLNLQNTEKYLNQPEFKAQIDIEFEPIWGDIPRSIQKLYTLLKDPPFKPPPVIWLRR